MIAATGNDEYNIIKCLEAREHGIRKVVAVNNEMEYYNLMHTLGLAVVRGPKMSTYHTIIERIHSSRIVTERKYCGGKATVFLRRIFPSSSLIGKKIRPYGSGEETVLFLLRNGDMASWKKPEPLEEGDVLVCFATEKASAKVEKWLYGL
jgi:trk system potassium uptake protein TrkA